MSFRFRFLPFLFTFILPWIFFLDFWSCQVVPLLCSFCPYIFISGSAKSIFQLFNIFILQTLTSNVCFFFFCYDGKKYIRSTSLLIIRIRSYKKSLMTCLYWNELKPHLPTANLAKSGPDICYFRSNNPKQWPTNNRIN